MQQAVEQLFDRNGAAPVGAVKYDEKGKPFFMQPRKCGRCGGAGRSDRWAFTGFTCFDCNGSGDHKNGPAAAKLYTAEQLAKLNAAAAKRSEKRLAEHTAKVAAAEAEAALLSADFKAAYGALIERANTYLVARYGWDENADRLAYAAQGDFIYDIITRAERSSKMTEGQAAAITKTLDAFDANNARKRASQHVGEVGKRMDFVATVLRQSSFERRQFPATWLSETVWITTLVTDDGNTLVIKTPTFRPRLRAKYAFKATVKGHDVYNDENQTLIQRVTIKETLEEGKPHPEDNE